jgi:hypothetical protein
VREASLLTGADVGHPMNGSWPVTGVVTDQLVGGGAVTVACLSGAAAGGRSGDRSAEEQQRGTRLVADLDGDVVAHVLRHAEDVHGIDAFTRGQGAGER